MGRDLAAHQRRQQKLPLRSMASITRRDSNVMALSLLIILISIK